MFSLFKKKKQETKKLEPTYNNHVVTFPSTMLKRISETSYEDAKRYNSAVQDIEYKHFCEEFNIKGDTIHPPIHFNYIDIDNISLEFKLKLIDSDFIYNDYIEELDQYFYGIFYRHNKCILRTHFKNLLLNEGKKS